MLNYLVCSEKSTSPNIKERNIVMRPSNPKIQTHNFSWNSTKIAYFPFKDKSMLERLEDIAKLPSTKQKELFNVLDAYLRDFKTSKACAK